MKCSFKIKRGHKWESRNIHFSFHPFLFQKPFPFPSTPFTCLATSFPPDIYSSLTPIQRPASPLRLFTDNKRTSLSCYLIQNNLYSIFSLYSTSCALNIKKNAYTGYLIVEWQILRLMLLDMWPFLRHPEMFSDYSQARALWVICAFWEWVCL